MAAARCPVYTGGLDLGCHRFLAGKVLVVVSGLWRIRACIVFHASWQLRSLEMGTGRRRGRGRPEDLGRTSMMRAAHGVVPA